MEEGEGNPKGGKGLCPLRSGTQAHLLGQAGRRRMEAPWPSWRENWDIMDETPRGEALGQIQPEPQLGGRTGSQERCEGTGRSWQRASPQQSEGFWDVQGCCKVLAK